MLPRKTEFGIILVVSGNLFTGGECISQGISLNDAKSKNTKPINVGLNFFLVFFCDSLSVFTLIWSCSQGARIMILLLS